MKKEKYIFNYVCLHSKSHFSAFNCILIIFTQNSILFGGCFLCSCSAKLRVLKRLLSGFVFILILCEQKQQRDVGNCYLASQKRHATHKSVSIVCFSMFCCENCVERLLIQTGKEFF